jgi:PhnB protein
MLIDEGDVEGAVPARPAEFHVYVEDVDAAFDRAMAAGATSLGAPADRPYGERAALSEMRTETTGSSLRILANRTCPRDSAP